MFYVTAQADSKILYENAEGIEVVKTALKKNELEDLFYQILGFLTKLQ